MALNFYKYQGTGNDFIVIDNRLQIFSKNNTNYIAKLCDRRFGIGADGLLLLENHETADFKMVYYNADGKEGTMCGNGGRCITAFAKQLGIINKSAVFEAVDGLHESILEGEIVKLKMQNVTHIQNHETYQFLNTGSPHHVQLTQDIENSNVLKKGAEIRYNKTYNEKGVNVNFVEKVSETVFKVRTYERGVEAETLSCGTGVTAVALAMHFIKQTRSNKIKLVTPGGNLMVSFKTKNNEYHDIWLQGNATLVFKGKIT
ncbi:MAG TPA: diaminopimelate epimerase [Flavobacteriaceae bacterium]|nr:diaminopimelate epimerase [Flavobacteriaceae bacterium]